MTDLIFNALKGQVNSLNFLLLLLLSGLILMKKGKRKASLFTFAFCFLFFAVASTGYLPPYLIKQMESRYPPFMGEGLTKSDTFYIQVLGGGYTFDYRIPPTSQLSWASLGRMNEGVRLAQLYPNSKIIFSGNIASGHESMAFTAKEAAASLGMDTTRLLILEEPSSTQEEALAFAKRFGTNSKLVLVTDAVHMPRAIRFFKVQGINPIPAPTNYLIKDDSSPIDMRWLPAIDNMQLMDRMIREWMGSLKGLVVKA